MSFISGVSIEKLCGTHVAQAVRNDVADRIIRIKFKEMFFWQFMNTDPHFGNFTFNTKTSKLGLLDFGCCMHLASEMSKDIISFIHSSASKERTRVIEWYKKNAIYVEGQDPKSALTMLMETNENTLAPFSTDAIFDFETWYESPKMQGIKDNIDYQSQAWDAQELPHDTKYASHMMMLVEYLLQLVLHAGRLKARISVRKYLLEALVNQGISF